MSKHSFTPEELDDIHHRKSVGKRSWAYIAACYGVTESEVKSAWANYVKRDSREDQQNQQDTTIEEDKLKKDEAYWESQYQKLFSKYEKLLTDNTIEDKLVNRIASLAPVSYSTPPPASHIYKPSGTPHSLVVMLSDTHIGKHTDLGQTLGFEEYNFGVFADRLAHYEKQIVNISQYHINDPLEELVIVMLGDMLDGSLDHGVEAGQRDTMIQQWYSGGHVIAQFITNLSPYFKKIRIETVVGNHTRGVGRTQRKMPTENRFSNYDMFLYAYIEALTANVANVKWNLTKQPFAIFDVQKHTFFASHGDHWRGGDKAFGLPLHAINRQVSSLAISCIKQGKPVPQYYLSGHLHRPVQLPHGLGEITINGGFPGLDNYALAEGFTPSDPVQTMFSIGKSHGKSGEWRIYLKNAEKDAGLKHYKLKDIFKNNG